MARARWTIRSAAVLCALGCALAMMHSSSSALGQISQTTAEANRRQGQAAEATLPLDSLLLDAPETKSAAPVGQDTPQPIETQQAAPAAELPESERTSATRIAASTGETEAAIPHGKREEALGASEIEDAETTDEVAVAEQAGGGWMDPASRAAEAQPLGAPSQQRGGGAATGGTFSGSGIMRTLLALGIVIGLIYACRGVLRLAVRNSGSLSVLLTAGGRAPAGVLEVLGRYPIAKRTTLVLLKVDCRVLLLSQSEQGFQTLAEITDPEEVASILRKTSDEQSESLSDRFASIFRQFERGGGVENTSLEPEVIDLTGSRNPLASLRMRLAGMQERRA